MGFKKSAMEVGKIRFLYFRGREFCRQIGGVTKAELKHSKLIITT